MHHHNAPPPCRKVLVHLYAERSDMLCARIEMCVHHTLFKSRTPSSSPAIDLNRSNYLLVDIEYEGGGVKEPTWRE